MKIIALVEAQRAHPFLNVKRRNVVAVIRNSVDRRSHYTLCCGSIKTWCQYVSNYSIKRRDVISAGVVK